jgi:hypothetical protein
MIKVKGHETKEVVLEISEQEVRRVAEKWNEDKASVNALICAVESALVRDFRPTKKGKYNEELSYRVFDTSSTGHRKGEWGYWVDYFHGSDEWYKVQDTTDAEHALFEACNNLRNAVMNAKLAKENNDSDDNGY